MDRMLGFPTADPTGDLGQGLDQALRHPSGGGNDFPDGKSGQQTSTPWGYAVLALAGRAFFQLLIHLVSDPASLLDRLLHGKNKTRDGLIGVNYEG